MKLLLLLPDGRIHKIKGPITRSLREAPLTMTLLAALVPAEVNAEITLADESIDGVPGEGTFDLVAITVMTGTSHGAYRWADHFRARGIPVVLGGVHVTLCPDEAALHADAIVTGFAERTWPQLLRDFTAGEMKARYHDPEMHLEGLPQARRDLQKRFGYMMPTTMFASRGCKGACDFCTVPAADFGWHTRPVHEVIDELRRVPDRRVAFNDVSITEDREYAKELFTAMIPLKKKWGGLCTTRIAEDEELLDLMTASGCRYMLIGFESLSAPALEGIQKGFNRPDAYANLMRRMHDRRILIQGCFIFGFEHDTKDVFRETVEMVDDLRIDIPRYAIYTPYPGTKAYHRLKGEGRLLHENWRHYDTQHVVFRPAQMSPEELDAGFRWAHTRTFTLRSMVHRTMAAGIWFPVAFVGNLAYRRYLHRLQADQERILAPEA
jgi:radical SAM superfamily enzyme YgiQ (UPF0313 family)